MTQRRIPRRTTAALAGAGLIALAAAPGAAAAPATPDPARTAGALAAADSGALADAAAEALGALPALPGAPGAPGAAAVRQPWFGARVPATATRVIAVESTGGSDARLLRYRRVPGGWAPVGDPVAAKVGSAGIGADYREGVPRTPAGAYPLESAFGRAPDPGAKLPYRRLDGEDWWVSDPASPAYNTHQRCRPGTCPFDESRSEHLIDYAVYDHALVMGVNRARVPGAGSAFFIHSTNGAATGGCVAVPTATVVELLRWADAGTWVALR